MKIESLYRLPVRSFKFIFRKISLGVFHGVMKIPYFHFIKNTMENQNSCTFFIWFMQKIIGFNRDVYWPVHFTSRINIHKNIYVGVDTNPGLAPGCYIQGIGKVRMGDYTQVAQNVGIVSMNHDLFDLRKHDDGKNSGVKIGSYCWLGMNSVVLPGVELGDFTIVGAGSVVTSSFEEGYCVVAGNPAKLIKRLDPNKCVRHEVKHQYIGYMRVDEFNEFKKKLWY